MKKKQENYSPSPLVGRENGVNKKKQFMKISSVYCRFIFLQ